nr:transglutaminaseTgpA domain-containing protein [Angustibacter aerolatus]
MLLLDRRRTAYDGEGAESTFEWAVSAVASLAVHLVERGYAVRLVDGSEGDVDPAWDHASAALAQVSAAGVLDSLATTSLGGEIEPDPRRAQRLPGDQRRARGRGARPAVGRRPQPAGRAAPAGHHLRGAHRPAADRPGRGGRGRGDVVRDAAALRRLGRRAGPGRRDLRPHLGPGRPRARRRRRRAHARSRRPHHRRRRPMTVRDRLTGPLAALATILTLWSMRPVVEGARWVATSVVVVLLTLAVGAALRWARVPAGLVLLGQAVVAAVVLTVVFAGPEAVLGLVPGPDAFGRFGELLRDAGDTVNRYSAPVPSSPGIDFMVSLGVAVIALAVDSLAVSLRSPAAAGLPLLALYCVPAAVVPDGLPWRYFAVAAVGWLLLLAHDAGGAVTRWGRLLPRWGGGAPSRQTILSDTSALAATGRRLGVVAVLAAVLVPAVLPGLPDGLLTRGGTGGTGTGTGTLSVINPVLQPARQPEPPAGRRGAAVHDDADGRGAAAHRDRRHLRRRDLEARHDRRLAPQPSRQGPAEPARSHRRDRPAGVHDADRRQPEPRPGLPAAALPGAQGRHRRRLALRRRLAERAGRGRDGARQVVQRRLPRRDAHRRPGAGGARRRAGHDAALRPPAVVAARRRAPAGPRGDAGREHGLRPGDGAAGVVPLEGRLHLQHPGPGRLRRRRGRRLPAEQAGVLHPVRLGDGHDVALAGHPGSHRRRLPARHPGRSEHLVGAPDRRARLARACTSRASAGCGSSRPPPPAPARPRVGGPGDDRRHQRHRVDVRCDRRRHRLQRHQARSTRGWPPSRPATPRPPPPPRTARCPPRAPGRASTCRGGWWAWCCCCSPRCS